jgi:hypothetical protein
MSYTHTLITVKEAAKMLGLAEKTVHNHRGGTCKLTRIRRGRSVRMIRQEVQQHLESLIKTAQRRHEKNDAASTRATASREGCCG